ncbi:hypothetical protein Pmani_017686 [Petrolisthes manimaculis]|uniref:Uncharacterized protein n=1 Tax=Petrolisthes manimaculis TaxID=1843537 RepID=A0AAE1PLV6_9EUCA|nr:hypothetical protein Pmani_017686 [Petrolisthes manimaculis]
MYSSPSSRKTSVYRLRSAPTSRASSIPRYSDEEQQQQPSPNNQNRNFTVIPRLSLTRPRTLERDKPSWHSKTLTPHNRSKSQCREDEVIGKRRSDSCSIPYRRRDSLTLSPSRVSFQDYHGLPLSSSSTIENTQTRSTDNQQLFWPRSTSKLSRSMINPDYSYSDYQSYDPFDDEAVDNTRSVETLESDLTDLMNQIAQRYQGSANTPSPPRSESPPPYEQVLQQKSHTKPVPSLQKSAPGSLSGSRRTSQDLGIVDKGKKSLYRCHKKKQNQF